MIKEVTMYTTVCDNCGRDSNEGSEYSCWADKSTAEDMAINSDWETKDHKKHYCPNCFEYDDEDNFVIKSATPNQKH